MPGIKLLGKYFVLLSLFSQFAFSQNTPFLSDIEILNLTNEISGDRAFEHIRWLTHWHRNSGMDGYFKAADYVVQAAKDAGLEDVKFIEQPRDGANYTAKSAELWMIEPVEVKLADIGDHALYLADNSSDADVTAELVWIEDGSKEALENIDVAGKIVLIHGSPWTGVQRAVWEKGAIGVVSYTTSESRSMLDFPDQIAWTRIPTSEDSTKKATFAFNLPPRKGENLRKILQTEGEQDFFATGKRTKGGRIVVKAKVEVEIGDKAGRTGFIEGWIRGSKYHDQQIVLTAHLQEEQGSANDDGSGCGNLLEIARVFNKLIAEGKMQRPLRDIRFWWTDEIYSEYRYFQDNPQEPKKFLANLHQDMTGAKQSMGSRVQHLIFAPLSITSYLDALFENIGTYVVRTNNAYLAASRSGPGLRPHTRPIYSTRGTREGFNAAFVPYFGASDYMCFIEGIIGVPAVGLINWDDSYIHSSDDDLFQVDQTQLARNSFIVAAMAHFLAHAEADEVPLLAEETYLRGQRSLNRDLQAAMQLVLQNDDLESWKDANLLVGQGLLREKKAMRSIAVFAGKDNDAQKLLKVFDERIAQLGTTMTGDLTAFYKNTHSEAPPKLSLSAEEKTAMQKIPENIDSLNDYFSKRRSAHFRSDLHNIMQSEVYNFVDGSRSYYDIYKAVRAEALTFGSWYYGTVGLQDVTGLLDAAVEAGALKLK
ncbi:M28 family peptidase [candidate division KSB1 bacterium]|nr:M28 family peptidase [candidate division KSB1 bacterium]